MGMFHKYDNLCPDYIPDNSSLRNVETNKTFEDTSLVVVHNKKGELIGYGFNEGNSVVLDTGLSLTAEVELDALVYTEANKYPDTHTQGHLGQRAYNIVNLKSYTCFGTSSVSVLEDLYVWKEDKSFTLPLKGHQTIEITPYADYDSAIAKIVNFRGETVLDFEISCIDKSITIDKEMSNLLKQGVYYLEVYVFTMSERSLATKYKLIVNGGTSIVTEKEE